MQAVTHMGLFLYNGFIHLGRALACFDLNISEHGLKQYEVVAKKFITYISQYVIGFILLSKKQFSKGIEFQYLLYNVYIPATTKY